MHIGSDVIFVEKEMYFPPRPVQKMFQCKETEETTADSSEREKDRENENDSQVSANREIVQEQQSCANESEETPRRSNRLIKAPNMSEKWLKAIKSEHDSLLENNT